MSDFKNVFPNAEQMERLIAAVGTVGDSVMSSADVTYLAMLNESNYKTTMKKWFMANGVAAVVDFSVLCDRWYTLTRLGWTGGVRFKVPVDGVSTPSDGTKTEDNAGLTCVPSTLTQANRDDYAGNPLFACVDCNVVLDSTGKPHITAIDGICGAFERFNPDKIVGVMQMTGWLRYYEDSTVYGWDYTDEIGAAGFRPLSEAVELADNTVRPWVVHGKYAFGDNWSCCSNVACLVWSVSHDSQLTGIRAKWGNRYCGATSADDTFLKLMLYLKYGQLDSDRVLAGCNSYNYTFTLAAGETGVERLLLTPAQAANLLVGSTVCVGTSTGRSASKANDTALLDRRRITKIETVTVGGVSYGAVYVDNGGVTFDTSTSYTLYTYQWYTGTTDGVQGNDGGIDPTNDRYPVKLQGIEIMLGAYEAMGDTMLQYGAVGGVNCCTPQVCRDATKLSTTLNASYRASSFGLPTPEAAGWVYPSRMGFDPSLPELIYPSKPGGSSSTALRDGFYLAIVTAGPYEWLRFGFLTYGQTKAGFSCGHGSSGLEAATWNIGGRLSVTGNRGEYQTA